MEAKTFCYREFNGNLLLKEMHKNGEREISLSLVQAKWIRDVLLE